MDGRLVLKKSVALNNQSQSSLRPNEGQGPQSKSFSSDRLRVSKFRPFGPPAKDVPSLFFGRIDLRLTEGYCQAGVTKRQGILVSVLFCWVSNFLVWENYTELRDGHQWTHFNLKSNCTIFCFGPMLACLTIEIWQQTLRSNTVKLSGGVVWIKKFWVTKYARDAPDLAKVSIKNSQALNWKC